MNYSIEVHESIAVFVELEYTKEFNEKKYWELKNDYKVYNKKYYVQYKYRKLEQFHGCKDAINSIMNIANVAMEINLFELEILKKSIYQKNI